MLVSFSTSFTHKAVAVHIDRYVHTRAFYISEFLKVKKKQMRLLNFFIKSDSNIVWWLINLPLSLVNVSFWVNDGSAVYY